jgi:hypothetical protein
MRWRAALFASTRPTWPFRIQVRGEQMRAVGENWHAAATGAPPPPRERTTNPPTAAEVEELMRAFRGV